MAPNLPKSVRNIYGVGAYDRQAFYRLCHAKDLIPLVPPRKEGRLGNQASKPWMKQRKDALRSIQGCGEDGAARSL
ncbi:hypothetical protein [Parachlamydia sp. AcF125]|uniref:hypothetical protein n=1 Tax=Parachlamydia sp. AcF125 TaxID=2795736 RepID=UPI001BC926B8|nr:hypothetical protein [Parachlamydia sp. AcF125]